MTGSTPRRRARRCASRLTAALLVGAAGCAPALDWREFDPEGFDLHVSFPCRPDRSSRPVPLGGARVTMTMLACSADGQTFAVGFVDAAEPSQVGDALTSLRKAAADNLGATPPALQPMTRKGMAPDPASGTAVIDGRLPDGRPVRLHLALFVKARRVYQAVVVGAAPGRETVETFFEALGPAR